MSVYLKCGKILRLSASLVSKRSCCTVGNKGLVLGVYSDDGKNLQLTPAANNFNNVTNGKLLESIKLAGEIKEGKHFVFWGLDNEYKSVAVVGLGKQNRGYDGIERICLDREAVRVASAVGCKALESFGIKEIAVEALGDSEAAAEGSTLATWNFKEYKTKKQPPPNVTLYSHESAKPSEWQKGVIKGNGQNLARRLADTPANLMTPTIFSQNVEEIFNNLNVRVDVHDKDWAVDKKMFAFLAVAQGSVQPPKFVELTYNTGSKDTSPYVLIGKGVTFDAGGISIKPSLKMDLMRGDMTGAACVVAALQTIATLKLEKNIKVLIPLVENMPSGNAIKPGDVVTAMNGKSICIDNTDAEGRLILADTLCYSSTFKPKWVLDIATLTGSIVESLGSSSSGVFTNSQKLFEILEKAGASTGDRVWQFPLWKHFSKLVTDYPAYDVNNVGKGKGAGACRAAAFLKEFAPENVDWLHVDIASVMGFSEDPAPYLTGMTGRPTRTLVEFIDLQK